MSSGTLVATASAALAALAASGGLIFNGIHLSRARKQGDLSALLKWQEQVRAAEDAVLQASDDQRRTRQIDYLNLLEVYAAAINHRLLGSVTRMMARDRLVNDLGIFISHAPDLFAETLTSQETFAEIVRFYKRNKNDVDDATRRETQRRK